MSNLGGVSKLLDLAQNRDGKNFIGELITCFKGSDGYKIIMECSVIDG